MTYPLARVGVQQDSGASRGQQVRDPVSPPAQESQLFKQLTQECPTHRIESFRYIDLQQNAGALTCMKKLSHSLNNPKIVVQGSASNECALVGLHERIHVQCLALGQNFSSKLTETVYQADQPVVLYLVGTMLLL
jgi:hypothetical protein